MKETDPLKQIKRIKGIPTNALIVPAIITFATLLVVLLLLIIISSRKSEELSRTTQETSIYTSTASSMLASMSLCTETSGLYIVRPLAEDGSTNYHSLIPFAGELEGNRSGDKTLEAFRGYNVSPEILEKIEEAAGCYNTIASRELKAIALRNIDYPIPKNPELESLKLPEISAAEKSLTPEQRSELCLELLYGEETGNSKDLMSTDIYAVIGSLQMNTAQMSAVTGQSLKTMRIWMWIVASLILLNLVISFVAVYRLVLSPLKRFSRLIVSDNSMNDQRGLKEVRLVAFAYNGLLERRDKLESILRTAAETDALTNLPNRYSFEKYLQEIESADCSLTVFAFDVNYLKVTNDTLGHEAGDKLLQEAAQCILSCFQETDDVKCFRIGGDEFEAVLLKADPEKAEQLIQLFVERQDEMNISISYGFSHADCIKENNIHDLIRAADSSMYEQKKKMHLERNYV